MLCAGRAGSLWVEALPVEVRELADRREKVARQTQQRVAGEPITDRIVSLADPDARPIRKGKLASQTSSDMSRPASGGRPRRWLSAWPYRRGARRADTPAGYHLRPPGIRFQTHKSAAAALPNRRGGPNRLPQAPLRNEPQPLEGLPRPTHLNEWGIPAYDVDTLAVAAGD